MEPHRRAAAGTDWGVVGELSGQPLGPLPGKRRAESWSLHGPGPCTMNNGVSYPVCTVPANLNNRRVLYAGESAGGAVRRHPRAVGRRDHDGLSGPEAVVPAPRRQRRAPQWQLDLGALPRGPRSSVEVGDRGYGRRRRTTKSRRPRIRPRPLRLGPDAPGQLHRRVPVAAVDARRAAGRSRRTGSCRGSWARGRATGSP